MFNELHGFGWASAPELADALPLEALVSPEPAELAELDHVPDRLPVLECAHCEVAYLIRVGLSLTTGRHAWRYYPDCRHKGRQALASIRTDNDEPVFGDGPSTAAAQ